MSDLPSGARRYLVGGAVRDRLLGRPQVDRDYVVVGATPEAMLAAGYQPVGADFPVFLHPQTRAEHALARTERKSGRGYAGFVFDARAEVTLEEDLLRRDFTINAMAEDEEGRLVDPYHGARDLEQRVLRHVSPAFLEDPVRLLRGARFLARYAPLGFRLAAETRDLMCAMVVNGEIEHLVPERVAAELRKALVEPVPSAFLRCLREVGALKVLLPEVDALYGVPQRPEFHPEVDSGIHTEMVLDRCPLLAPGDDIVAFAALTHDLGKALTPPEEWPKHVLHEQRGEAPIKVLGARLKLPREHIEFARLCSLHHLLLHRLHELRPATVLKLIESFDGLRKPERIQRFALLGQADKQGRLGCAEEPYPQAQQLLACLAAAQAIDARELVAAGLSGPAIGEAMRRRRIAAIATVIASWGEARPVDGMASPC